MQRLFDRLISHRVLNYLRVDRLRSKLDFLTFPPGHPILCEGVASDKILLTLCGKCELRKRVEDKDEGVTHVDTAKTRIKQIDNSVHVGYASPLTFLGIVPRAMEKGEREENIDRCQSLSVVAHCTVRVLVIDAHEFLICLGENPSILKVFHDLASRQMEWLKHSLPQKLRELTNEENSENQHNEEESSELIPTVSMVQLGKLIQFALTKKPRFNKHKILARFQRFVVGNEMGNETDDDPFSEVNFTDLSMNKLQEDVERDWGNSEEEYHLLRPFPSISNRKFHGKTLPIISSSDGFQNPLKQG